MRACCAAHAPPADDAPQDTARRARGRSAAVSGVTDSAPSGRCSSTGASRPRRRTDWVRVPYGRATRDQEGLRHDDQQHRPRCERGRAAARTSCATASRCPRRHARDGADVRATRRRASGVLSNRVSSIFPLLPIQESDPAERVALVAAEVDTLAATPRASRCQRIMEIGRLRSADDHGAGTATQLLVNDSRAQPRHRERPATARAALSAAACCWSRCCRPAPTMPHPQPQHADGLLQRHDVHRGQHRSGRRARRRRLREPTWRHRSPSCATPRRHPRRRETVRDPRRGEEPIVNPRTSGSPTAPFASSTPARGPRSCCCTGSEATWRNWIANIPGLGDGHRVIAPDLPGFGASRALPRARSRWSATPTRSSSCSTSSASTRRRSSATRWADCSRSRRRCGIPPRVRAAMLVVLGRPPAHVAASSPGRDTAGTALQPADAHQPCAARSAQQRRARRLVAGEIVPRPERSRRPARLGASALSAPRASARRSTPALGYDAARGRPTSRARRSCCGAGTTACSRWRWAPSCRA